MEFRKLGAIMKKNLILMKRNLFQTSLEIFFPIIIMFLLVLLRIAFKIDYYSFDQENNMEDYLYSKGFATITDIDEKEAIRKNLSWFKIKYVPPFYPCSKYNIHKQARPYIASIGIPEEIKEQMIKDSHLMDDYLDDFYKLDREHFKEFKSIEEMENYVKAPGYIKDADNLLCFGLKFSYDNKTDKYDFSLHFFDFDSYDNQGVSDIPDNEKGMFDKFRSGPDFYNYLKYQSGQYSYVLKSIYEYLLRKETGNNEAKIDFASVPMKYFDFKYDTSRDYLGYIITVFIIIAYMVPLSIYIYRIVEEKEKRMKEGMKIMGLREVDYFFSYFIQFFIISLVVSFFNSLLLHIVLEHIPLKFVYFLFVLWSLDIFALIYFFQSLVDKSKISISVSLVIYFLMYCVSLSVLFEKTSRVLKIILSIFPGVSLSLGSLLFMKFEVHFKRFHDQDYFKNHYNFSVENMYIMFIADFFIYLFLGYYLNNVLPHEYGIPKPWYFLCTKNFWCYSKKKTLRNSINKDIELPYYNEGEIKLLDNDINIKNTKKEKKEKNDNLELKNIVKIFGDGIKALDGVNLEFYKDEIFALLGHNGAGKTTLISILTGIYGANEGQVIYKGLNVLDGNNMDFFRGKLGICPQYDILYDNLTVREHLEMFCVFKGVEARKVDAEIDKILCDLQMKNIENFLTKNLSAGQRKKLSIAVALIGGSEIIFLDEPSSGIDITSRRHLWEILRHLAKGKIIILTTHYMEEASILGKRIGIISSGKMKCIGSPLFLIEKYGKYMTLTISKDENADNNQIIDFISNLAENVESEILSEEIIFKIPIKEEDIIENKVMKKINLQIFFEKFDENLENLNIKSYSVSMPTLEDVFLNIASEDNKKSVAEKNENIMIESKNYDNILFDSDLKVKYIKKEKFKNDFLMNMKRRYLIMKRDIKGFLIEFLSPILLLLIGLLTSKIEMSLKSYPIVIDMSITGKQTILFSSISQHTNLPSYFIDDDLVENKELEIGGQYERFQAKDAIIMFLNKSFEESNFTEDSSTKEVDMTSVSYKGYYGSLLFIDEDEYNHNYKFVMGLNARVQHAVPIYTHFLLKSIVEKASGHKLNIKFTHYPLPMTYDVKEIDSLKNNLAINFFLAIAFGIIPLNFISHLVKERENSSKHLMRITGMSIISYWIVNYIYELTKYYITLGICLLLLRAFKYYKKFFYIFYLLYGPGLISLTYLLSFYLNDSNAQNAIVIMNLAIGDLGAIVIYLFRLLHSTKKIALFVEYILTLIPTFSFDFAFTLLLNSMVIFWVDYRDEWHSFRDDSIIRKFNLLLSILIYLSVECVLYPIILILKEKRTYIFQQPPNKLLISNKSEIKDIGVKNEIKRSNFDEIQGNGENNIKAGSINEKEKFAIRIKNLRKIYRNVFLCCKSKKNDVTAIKNLNFCLEKGECFGILGPNGSGKTTTFKCITQEFAQDNGRIFINGEIISNNFSKLNDLFGYCPQSDAIFEYLTVYENLEFYAGIKGIKKNMIKILVDAMIKEMTLEEFRNKISGQLSGGNKRKLSVAISMLGNPPIILLDEPSSGMDPESRRFMWSIIHKISTKGKNSSIILTTNLMEEAEVLCRRIGILLNGEFVCLGKSKEIKERYGYGYEINLKIKSIEQSQIEEILRTYNINDMSLMVNERNMNEIFNNLDKQYFLNDETPFGKNIKYMIRLNRNISITILYKWIYYIENALKFIKKGKKYYNEIILAEHIEDTFLFKINKEGFTKTTGFLFGLFEENKDECNIIEYSIKETSIGQIFNKLSSNQDSFIGKVEEQENNWEKNIIIDDELLNNIDN